MLKFKSTSVKKLSLTKKMEEREVVIGKKVLYEWFFPSYDGKNFFFFLLREKRRKRKKVIRNFSLQMT